jgi:hypothetical protein
MKVQGAVVLSVFIDKDGSIEICRWTVGLRS